MKLFLTLFGACLTCRLVDGFESIIQASESTLGAYITYIYKHLIYLQHIQKSKKVVSFWNCSNHTAVASIFATKQEQSKVETRLALCPKEEQSKARKLDTHKIEMAALIAGAEGRSSGLCGEIRSALESEQYDLGGYTESRARDLILQAFGKPLDAPTKMIRCQFLVGGGKLVRSKYDELLPKWLTAALREIGFVEDRSAAETFDSQGTFKMQHDTGQNLKYLIVYPHVTCAPSTSSADSGSSGSKKGEAEPVMDTKSPEYLITASSLEILQEICASKTPTWRQKKKVVKVLQDGIERFKQIEQKLISGNQLTAQEQTIYDGNCGQDDEKLKWIQGEVKKMVDEGKLSSSEKDELLAQIEENLRNIEEEISAAKAENKPKKVETLEGKKATILARKESVSKLSPCVNKLKFADEILRVRLKLLPLLALEDKGRSMSLTLADLKSLEEKSELETKIQQLENASRGWFEDDADFAAKCAAVEKEAQAKWAAKKTQGSGSKGGGGGSKGGLGSGGSRGGAGGWSTVAVKSSVSKKPTSGPSKASGFAAAFGGGDSDSD